MRLQESSGALLRKTKAWLASAYRPLAYTVSFCFCLGQPARSTTLPHLFYLTVIFFWETLEGGFAQSIGDLRSLGKGSWEVPKVGEAAQQVV